MKNIIIRITLVFLSVNCYSQITTEILNPLVYEDFDLSGWDDIKIHVLVKNTSTDTINLKWKINRSEENCNEEWATSYYDYNLCYIEWITSNVDPDISLYMPVIMPPGFQYEQILVGYPNHVAGCCNFSFDFSEAENPDNILASVYLPVQINQENCFTSTNDNEVDHLKIYPNPFNDIIRLECESEINRVEIYNINGQLLYNRRTENRDILELGFLYNGMYFIALFDEKNEALKTVSIVKE